MGVKTTIHVRIKARSAMVRIDSLLSSILKLTFQPQDPQIQEVRLFSSSILQKQSKANVGNDSADHDEEDSYGLCDILRRIDIFYEIILRQVSRNCYAASSFRQRVS